MTPAFLYKLSNRSTVQNLNFDNACIYTPRRSVGVIAGEVGANCKIINCNVKNSSVTSLDTIVGGIAGSLIRSGCITDCSVSDTTLKGKKWVGGIVGTTKNDRSSNTKAAIINCHTLGGCISAQTGAGGILSEAITSTDLIACTNSASVTVSGEGAGGISYYGYTYITACANYTSEISSSTSTGSISGSTYSNTIGSFGFFTDEKNIIGESIPSDDRDGIGDTLSTSYQKIGVKLYDADTPLTKKDVTEMNAAIDDYNKNKQTSDTDYCHWKWQYNSEKAPTLYKVTAK